MRKRFIKPNVRPPATLFRQPTAVTRAIFYTFINAPTILCLASLSAVPSRVGRLNAESPAAGFGRHLAITTVSTRVARSLTSVVLSPGDCCRGREQGRTGAERGVRHHQRVVVGTSTALPSDAQQHLGRKELDDHIPAADGVPDAFRRALDAGAAARRRVGARGGGCPRFRHSSCAIEDAGAAGARRAFCE